MTCTACGHENRPGAKFCEECAGPLKRLCASCGLELRPTAKFCDACGASVSAPAAPSEPAPAVIGPAEVGERRQLTVLFCDLVGSTPLSQQLDAEEWRDLIAQYQQAASGAVVRFGGHVAKNLGDGLLIYFGWPTAREDDPERAVRAGLAIVEAVRASVDERLHPNPPPFAEVLTGGGDRSLPTSPREWVPSSANISVSGGGSGRRPLLSVRVGMHTGPVVIADGGEVFGETANVAARVQGAAEPDTVVDHRCDAAPGQRAVALLVSACTAARGAPMMPSAAFAAGGLLAGAITNNWVAEDGGTRVLQSHFDVFVESAVVGIRKPDPRLSTSRATSWASLRASPSSSTTSGSI